MHNTHMKPAPREYLDLCRHADRIGLHVKLSTFPEINDRHGQGIAPGALNLLYVDSPRGTRLADAHVRDDLAAAARQVNAKLGVTA